MAWISRSTSCCSLPRSAALSSSTPGIAGSGLLLNGASGISAATEGSNLSLLNITQIEADTDTRHAAEGEAVRASYQQLDSGTIQVEGFEIRRSGLRKTPGGGGHPPAAARKKAAARLGGGAEALCQLTLLGRGASSVVYKALHVPSLRMVAQKVIPVYDDEKRRQMVRELRALHANIVPLDGEDGDAGAVEGGDAPPCPCVTATLLLLLLLLLLRPLPVRCSNYALFAATLAARAAIRHRVGGWRTLV